MSPVDADATLAVPFDERDRQLSHHIGAVLAWVSRMRPGLVQPILEYRHADGRTTFEMLDAGDERRVLVWVAEIAERVQARMEVDLRAG
jgi:hypothetical protein